MYRPPGLPRDSARTCASATSSTCTMDKLSDGAAGTEPFRSRLMVSKLTKSCRSDSDGPTTKPGLIVTSSKPRPAGWFATSWRASFSASVLLFGYGSDLSASDQSSGVNVQRCTSSRPELTAAMLDVTITRFTLGVSIAACTTRLVPTRAAEKSSSFPLT